MIVAPRWLPPCPAERHIGPGLLPGAGGRAVAVQDFGLGLVPRGGGAVGVDDQGPAPAVDDDLVVEGAQEHAVFHGGRAAVGFVLGVVDLARAGGLVCSRRPTGSAGPAAAPRCGSRPGRSRRTRCPAAGSGRRGGRRAGGGAGTRRARPGRTAGRRPSPWLFYCILLS